MPTNRSHISAVEENDLDTLRTISIDTFTETFSEYNTAEDMQKYLSENLSKDRLHRELNTSGSVFYLMHQDKEQAGYMKLNEAPAQTVAGKPGTLEIERIYIRSAFHGKGLGKTLLDYAITYAQHHQHSVIWLGVWERNTKAIAFYERNGFVKTGSHEFVLGSDVQTDYLMELHLSDTTHAR